jgi:hypothetical protein
MSKAKRLGIEHVARRNASGFPVATRTGTDQHVSETERIPQRFLPQLRLSGAESIEGETILLGAGRIAGN